MEKLLKSAQANPAVMWGGMRSQNQQEEANGLSQVGGDSDWLPICACACKLGGAGLDKAAKWHLLDRAAAPVSP